MDQKENQQVEGQGADGDNILDDMDCRPDNQYPEANREAATPDYIREMLAQKKGQQPEPAPAPAADEQNPA